VEFYWDKNQLCVLRSNLAAPSRWTTFEIPLLKADPIPSPLKFMQFLASSITFMVNITDVEVFVDEYSIGSIKKKKRLPEVGRAVGVPGELTRSSPSGIMNVREIQCHLITIEGEVMHAVYTTGIGKSPSQEVGESCNQEGFFSSSQPPPQSGTPTSPQQPGDPTRLHKTTIDLTVFTAQVIVNLDDKLSAELLRSTMKRPPLQLKYHLIYTGKDEYDQSVAEQNDQTGMCDSIFQGLRADLNGAMHTRIFIGHATGQTTGIGGHMASYFIPTIERESIDLK
jgi:hypothetical protein